MRAILDGSKKANLEGEPNDPFALDGSDDSPGGHFFNICCGQDQETGNVLLSALAQSRGSARQMLLDVSNSGGTFRIEAVKVDETTVGLVVEGVPAADSRDVTIEVSPTLTLLRQDWERELGEIEKRLRSEKGEDSATSTKERTAATTHAAEGFQTRLLRELPSAAHINPSDPVDLMQLALFRAEPPTEQPKLVQWVEHLLAGQGAPPAADGEYHVTILADGTVLVRYSPLVRSSTVLESVAYARSLVPAAFLSPLRSSVDPPSGEAVEVVPVDLSELLGVSDPLPPNDFPDQIEQRVLGAVHRLGVEALGWYQSYHCWDDEHWGIYLHTAQLADLASILRRALENVRCSTATKDALEVVIRLVWEHEFFHARVDLFGLHQELITRKGLILPYHQQVYKPTWGTNQAVEEALANFTARQVVGQIIRGWLATGRWSKDMARTALEVIDQFLDAGPPGYSDWRDGNDVRTCRRLVSQLLTGQQVVREPLPPLESWLRDMPDSALARADVPVYLTTGHPLAEQLFHAPSVRELERFLRLQGYTTRKEGKHVKWVSEDGTDFFSVSHTNTVSVPVFHKLLRKLNLTKQEYLARRHEWR